MAKMKKEKPQVAVLMGSDSDWQVMQGAVSRLRDFGVACDVQVMSAHRTPAVVTSFVTGATSSTVTPISSG